MSMLGNLNNIKAGGIRKFIRNEKIRWTCPVCQNTICVHREDCIYCGTKRNKGT
jgi:biotin synthase-like enzyme